MYVVIEGSYDLVLIQYLLSGLKSGSSKKGTQNTSGEPIFAAHR